MEKFSSEFFSFIPIPPFPGGHEILSIARKKVMKIDHHRGPVVCVAISSTSEVLVSGSTDATICLWSLETYELLNLLQFNSPVINFCLSPDSVSAWRFSLRFHSFCILNNLQRFPFSMSLFSFIRFSCSPTVKTTVSTCVRLQPEPNYINSRGINLRYVYEPECFSCLFII